MTRHESIFSYNVTRQYPFRWFTPAVAIGTLVGLVCFTIVNLVTQGFNPVSKIVDNPVSEIPDILQIAGIPSWLVNRYQPSCQPATFAVGDQISTNNLGLSYTIEAIYQANGDGTTTPVPSLNYFNDALSGCSFQGLSVAVQGRERPAQQRAWMEWAPTGRGLISCNITHDPNLNSLFPSAEGASPMIINLTMNYDYVPTDVAGSPGKLPSLNATKPALNNNGLFRLLQQDEKNRASIFWGASALSMYWAQVATSMTSEFQTAYAGNPTNNSVATSFPSSGIVYLTRSGIPDITSLDFFKIDFRWFFDQSNGNADVTAAEFNSTINSLASTATLPNIWIPLDSFGKSFWSLVMTDLGQLQNNELIIAGKDDLLEHFTQNFSDILTSVANTKNAAALPGPATQSYSATNASAGTLGVTPGYIQTSFFCQVPEWKNAGEVFILVASQDLIFLSSLWKVWVLVVSFIWLRKSVLGPQHNYCEGSCDGPTSGLGGSAETSPRGAPEVIGLMSSGREGQETGTYEAYRRTTMATPPPISRYSGAYKSMSQIDEHPS